MLPFEWVEKNQTHGNTLSGHVGLVMYKLSPPLSTTKYGEFLHNIARQPVPDAYKPGFARWRARMIAKREARAAVGKNKGK